MIKGKKTTSLLLVAFLIMQTICSVTIVNGKSEKDVKIPKQQGSTQEYIVKTNEVITEDLNEEAKKEHIVSEEQTKELKNNDCLVLNLSNNQKKEVEKIEGVEVIEPNIEMEANAVIPINSKEADKKIASNTATISDWNAKMISLDGKKRGKNVNIAIIDSGVSYSENIQLKSRANLIESNLEEEGEPLFDDPSGHGTSIASIIASKGEDIKGVAKEANLYSIKVLDAENKAPLSRIIEGIYLCIDNDIDVINMSFGMKQKSKIFEKAIDEANKKNILMISSSGNKGENIEYPANYKNVISVGSVNSKGNISSFSSGGDKVDILAPGEKVWVNTFFNGYMPIDGTSISTAHVTGAAAIAKEMMPDINNDNFRKLLYHSSRKAKLSNGGILNIKDMVSSINKNDWIKTKVRKSISNKETSNTSDIVTGSWLSTDHRGSVISSELKIDELMTIAAMVQRVDKYYPVTVSEYSRMKCGALHGQHNYIANLHFLYYMARYAKIYNTYNFLNGDDIEKFYAEKGRKIKHTKDKKSGVKDYNNLKNAVKDVLTGKAKENGKPIRDIVNMSGKLKGNKLAAAIIMGYSAHLLGDIFAHRTMVPKAVATRKDGKNSIDFNDFIRGTDLKNRISAYTIETRDVDMYKYKDKSSKKLYEDNKTKFYSSRYSFTCKLMKRMLKLFSGEKGKAFDVEKIFTTGISSDFVLYVNNMYPYLQSAGYDSKQIKNMSTTKFRVDYPNGPNGKFYENEEDAVDYPSVVYK